MIFTMNLDKNIVFRLLLCFFGIFYCSCMDAEKRDIIRVGFSQCISDHEWRKAMNHSMEVEASLQSNVELTIFSSNYNTDKQIEDINQMIDEGYDAIIVSPLEPNSIVPVIERAYDAGIPVVLIDRKVNTDKFSTYVGGNNLEVGRDVGNYILSATKKKANIIEIKGGDNSSPVIERSLGFHQIVDANESTNLLLSIEGTIYGTPKERFAMALDSLGNEQIDYVFAFNDLMAHQAWQVARQKGLESGIKFIGVDGLNGDEGGINLVRTGILEASILYPTGGSEALQLAIKLANGEKVAKENLLGTTVINRRNADIMKNQYDKINDQQADLEKQTAAIKEQEERYYAQSKLLQITLVLFGIVLILALYSIYSIFTIRKKNRQLQVINHKITVQRNQIEKIAKEVKDSNEAKINFFTGLSHEFKTPLTLIMSAVDSLADSMVDKPRAMNELELIHTNSNRLLRLMNNLLDFRKAEDKTFNIRASITNIFVFSKNIHAEFAREAKRRGIKFVIDSNNKDLELFIDRNLMDKVFFNLLSNAFKFTPDNGWITIFIKDNEEGNDVNIHIKDNGIGIPEKEIKNVFDPFFKGSKNRKNSSGIGLHLSKQFIELHLGKIEVKSHKGTEFIITLFKGNTHFNEDHIIDYVDLEESTIPDFATQTVLENHVPENVMASDTEKYSILIVEDNNELSMFLRNKLMDEYDIIMSNGTDAIEKAFEFVPDIILCDVNLPEMSGFEICTILKNDLKTSHIPTIILTALDNKESYLKGLQSGADLYLTKPFSYAILIQSIKSMLYNREKLRLYYTNNFYKLGGTGNYGNLEQKFIDQLNQCIMDNIDDTDFSVEALADNLHVSRVQLYRKVKAIFGVSISDYISDIRLEKAKSMLENTSLPISEVAYASGFASPSYFSTSFKNKFGNSPGTFRKSSQS